MTWTPLQRLPNPLSLAFCDAVRATILQRDVGRGITRGGDGMLIVPMEEGAAVHVLLEPRSETAVKFGPRQAIRIDLAGRAVAGRMGYGLAATATIDVKSRCFMDVTCEIRWRDRAGGASI
jgi:hypothetical protein